MEFEKVLNNRHSSRKFLDKKINESLLIDLVRDAQQTPSWANSQPWKVILATGKTLETIKNNHLQLSNQGVVGDSDLETAHRTDWADYTRDNIGNWNNELVKYLIDNDIPQHQFSHTQSMLYDAPALIYLTVTAPVNDWEIFDTGAFAQTLMLSAANRGIQSMPAYEIIKYPTELRRILSLDKDDKILMGIALGYEDTASINKFKTSREDTNNILRIER